MEEREVEKYSIKEEWKEIHWPSVKTAVGKTAATVVFSTALAVFIMASDEIGKTVLAFVAGLFN